MLATYNLEYIIKGHRDTFNLEYIIKDHIDTYDLEYIIKGHNDLTLSYLTSKLVARICCTLAFHAWCFKLKSRKTLQLIVGRPLLERGESDLHLWALYDKINTKHPLPSDISSMKFHVPKRKFASHIMQTASCLHKDWQTDTITKR